MYSQVYYLLRSKQDGRHLAARPDGSETEKTFLLMFSADYEALSYLSTHASDLRDRFSVESVPAYQIKDLLSRWGFSGVGLVSDPMPPRVEFLQRDRFP
ncbi:hypothetical protein PN498_01630 [Oscillatoria sp. CS-180]|uniref:hypothetical protein n=1 Tax=Oscillatoria sp. CS-180 TaxID=3021720 RepID=UPI002330E537|nr:hypothetical protein [Oscillatoria sp. CS-180]MDB9524675.1 hypothetical protein [Oscillatoria sp. CS-180]